MVFVDGSQLVVRRTVLMIDYLGRNDGIKNW